MTRRRRLWLASMAVTLGLGASVLLAENSVVKTRDGGSYVGEVKERGDSVVVTNRGIDTVIPKANVASIERVGSYDDEFRARLIKLDPKGDVPARIAMAHEAFDKHRYDLARQAAESALAIDNNSREASDMVDLIQSQIRMERAKQDNPPSNAVAPAPMPPATGPAQVDRRYLSFSDVESIRRKELKKSDTNVRVRFDGDVKKRYADAQKIPFAEFNAKPPVEQALDILDNGDASMKDKVRILSDPQSVAEYRGQIQPLVIQNCATSGCHGGPNGGALLLYNNQAANDQVAYTNFYILQKYSKKMPKAPGSGTGGVFGGESDKRLIERGKGEDSLLANFGLPSSIGAFNHPPVNGKTVAPIFKNKDDARYGMVVNWMNNSLAPVEPDYGIQYTPPTAATVAGETQPLAPPAPTTRPGAK